MKPEPIQYMIVDDNELDRLVLGALAAAYPGLQHAGTFEHPLEALPAIKSIRPALLFLDVDMPGASGIDLLKVVRDEVPMAIFITSYPEYALDGFELSALDYILKPLTGERFAQCMKRVEEYWEMRQKSNAYDVLVEQDMLTIKQGHDKLRIPMHEIIYLEALNDYTKLHTQRKSYVTIGALSSFLEQTPDKYFQRIHRSYAVALNKITGLKKNEINCGEIILPVGKTYRPLIAQIKL